MCMAFNALSSGQASNRSRVQTKFEAKRLPSRVYGHTLADIIALSTIAVLAGFEGIAMFDAATELLRTKG